WWRDPARQHAKEDAEWIARECGEDAAEASIDEHGPAGADEGVSEWSAGVRRHGQAAAGPHGAVPIASEQLRAHERDVGSLAARELQVAAAEALVLGDHHGDRGGRQRLQEVLHAALHRR